MLMTQICRSHPNLLDSKSFPPPCEGSLVFALLLTAAGSMQLPKLDTSVLSRPRGAARAAHRQLSDPFPSHTPTSSHWQPWPPEQTLTLFSVNSSSFPTLWRELL